MVILEGRRQFAKWKSAGKDGFGGLMNHRSYFHLPFRPQALLLPALSACAEGESGKKLLPIYDLRYKCCLPLPRRAVSFPLLPLPLSTGSPGPGVRNCGFIYEHNGFLSRYTCITSPKKRERNVARSEILNKVSSVKSQVKF